MGIMSKYNKNVNMFSEVNFDDVRYFKLSEATPLDAGRKVTGVFKTDKGLYGTQYFVTVETDAEYTVAVDIPKHCNEMCVAILADTEAVEAIKTGHVVIKRRMYETKDGKVGYTVEWLDV